MKFKEFINKILFFAAVPKCSSCGERLLISDKALCEKCKREYDDCLSFNCSICSLPYYECECSNKYLKAHSVQKVYKVFRYFPGDEPPTNMLIYRLKRDNRHDVVEFLVSELKRSLSNKNAKLENTVITSVPRRRQSVRKYGFDHAEALGKLLAKELNLEYKRLLKSRAKKDQKKSNGKEDRLKNAQFDYIRNAPSLKGQNVLLVDDIITTGASIGAAATLIKGLGAKKITALALAIAYSDEYVPFKTDGRK